MSLDEEKFYNQLVNANAKPVALQVGALVRVASSNPLQQSLSMAVGYVDSIDTTSHLARRHTVTLRTHEYLNTIRIFGGVFELAENERLEYLSITKHK